MFRMFSLDVVSFWYAVVVLLAAGAFELVRSRRVAGLPWAWFVASLVFHALSEWGLCFKFNLSFTTSANLLSLVLMLAAMLTLVEFCRRSWPQVSRWRWSALAAPVALAVILSGALVSGSTLVLTIRFTSFCIGLCVLCTLWHHARGHSEVRLLRAAGAFFFLNTLTLVFSSITHGRPFPLVGAAETQAHLVSNLAHIGATSLLLFCGIGLARPAFLQEKGARNSFSAALALTGILLTIPVLATGAFTATWERRETTREREVLKTYLRAFREEIAGTAWRTDAIADVGGHSASLRSTRLPSAEAARASLREELARLCRPIEPAICSFLSESGEVVASSVHSSRNNHEGRNLSFRNYFNDALSAEKSSAILIDSVTHSPGYFSSRAVPLDDGSRGVLVVKAELMPHHFRTTASMEVFLLDAQGRVLVADAAQHIGRLLFPTAEENGVYATSPGPSDLFFSHDRIWEAHHDEIVIPQTRLVLVTEWPAGPARAKALALCMVTFAGLLMALLHQLKLRGAAQTIRCSKEGEARLLAIIDNATDLIGIATLSGEIIYTNPATRRLLGEKVCEGSHIQHLAPPWVNELLEKEAFPQVLATGCWMGETAVLTSEGSEIPTSQAIFLHRDRCGEPQYLSTIIRDASAARQMERERHEIQARLFHTDKLASIGTLAAGITHEINNPLAVVLGYVRILETQIRNGDAAPALLGTLEKQERAAKRIGIIVAGLKTFARIDDGAVIPVDVHDALEESLQLMTTLLEKGDITLTSELRATRSTVTGNAGKLQQVFVNLLTNARDALESSSEKRVTIRSCNEGNELILTFADTGPGMPPEVRARAFDPFFTTKGPGKGTGLGLSISHSIITAMNGTISIETDAGKGTAFVIRLPLHAMRAVRGVRCTGYAKRKS